MAIKTVTQADTGRSNDEGGYLPASTANESITIDGWASDCLTGGGAVPATCTNSNATPLDLMSWAFAQLQQMHVLLRTMSVAKEYEVDLDLPEILGAVRHFTEPVQDVIEVVAAKLFADQKKEGAA